MNLDDALQTFIAESRELLLNMEDLLLLLEREAQDPEALNAIFRAAHTIKGSAGLFGFETIVRFTHVVENLLDRARNNEFVIDEILTALLLECSDHMNTLIDAVAEGKQNLDDAVLQRQSELLGRLTQYASAHQMSIASCEPPDCVTRDQGAVIEQGSWHISLRFGRDVLRNGLDPASFVRYLRHLGEIVNITTLFDAMPPADEMDPESCYLGFEIDLMSDADKATIADAFEFVRDDCEIRILPPNSKIEEYVALISSFGDGNERLGEILIASGAVTRSELEQALMEQAASATGTSRLGEILIEEELAQPQVVQAALEKQKNVKNKRDSENRYIRVDAAKLGQLIDQVGEMVIANASASLIAKRSSDGALLEAMSAMGRLVEGIRDSALSLRMVEIAETFNRFQRVVRDVSKELGKEITLKISGGETELDKTVVEKIADPLTHLVRNSIDHGIESVDVRIARGKPQAGTIALNAFHESGGIVIKVSDDGGGLDTDRILAKAIEKGIVSSTPTLSEDEIFNLVFEPGFSTAEQVTDLSGRGVGMDVVRRNIEALRGNIELSSARGQGTTFTIRLPLTMAIIDGFLIEVGDASFVAPLDMVVECLEHSQQERDAMEQRAYLNLRGEILPLIRLRELLGIEGSLPARENIMVVRYGTHKAGLVVDQLLGEFQTVIKPLGQVFRHLRGISGSTILGSGDVALILDIPELVQQAASRENQQTARLSHPASASLADALHI